MDFEMDFYAIKDIKSRFEKLIKRLNEISSIEYKNEFKKRHFKEKAYFKAISKVILLVVKSLLTRRKYFHQKWLETIDSDWKEFYTDNETLRYSNLRQFHDSKSVLTLDSIVTLDSLPVERNDYVLKKIIWTLSQLGAFQVIIPKNKFIDLAKRVTFQRIENGRILAQDGRKTNQLYYIVSGKLTLVRRFKLREGSLFKIMGYLGQGETTDPIEVEKEMYRECTMFSKGVTELLCLEAADLKILRVHHHTLPIDYLLGLDVLQTYPLDHLMAKHGDAIVYKYFGPNQVICNDVKNSIWIYVIMSGEVKVVKKMKIYNLRPPNNQQRSNNFDAKSELVSDTSSEIIEFMPRPQLTKSKSCLNATTVRQNQVEPRRVITAKPSFGIVKSRVKSSITYAAPSPPPPPSAPSATYRLTYVVLDLLREGDSFGWSNNSDEDSDNDDYTYYARMRRNSLMERRNLILISSYGVELMMINKSFFYKYADLTTLCKIEKIEPLDSKYASEESVRDHFRRLQQWKIYKKDLIETLTN